MQLGTGVMRAIFFSYFLVTVLVVSAAGVIFYFWGESEGMRDFAVGVAQGAERESGRELDARAIEKDVRVAGHLVFVTSGALALLGALIVALRSKFKLSSIYSSQKSMRRVRSGLVAVAVLYLLNLVFLFRLL